MSPATRMVYHRIEPSPIVVGGLTHLSSICLSIRDLRKENLLSVLFGPGLGLLDHEYIPTIVKPIRTSYSPNACNAVMLETIVFLSNAPKSKPSSY